MEVLIEAVRSDATNINGNFMDCPGWCTYNPDSNCWDNGD